MYKKVVFAFLFLIVVLSLPGCLVFYNPATQGGEGYDKNIIKDVIQWFRYYLISEDINGLVSLIYPYSPYFDNIRDDYNAMFSTCDNIIFNYAISHILLEDGGKAVVTGEYVITSTCKEERGELYIQMKRSDEGVWYIYNINLMSVE